MSPKLKESKGTLEFRGACIAELQRLVFFECASAQQWNRDKITQSFAGPGSWEFTGPGWIVRFQKDVLVVHSKGPRVHLRGGMYFDMGNGRLVIS